MHALIGRGESYLLLSKEALQSNFDGKAVDYVSLAVQDLVRCVSTANCAYIPCILPLVWYFTVNIFFSTLELST